ncbi:MAG: amino acid ABC transporter substrate-binding protein [Gammaproteobacteria bacterium]|nr:MAG: amino acid ABC transporter substrate-binding protein [Gammaproteobacteria bacterium]
MRQLLVGVAFATMFIASSVSAGTLERVRDSGVFKIGYRTDAAPYAYKTALGEAAGYSVDLCRAVAVTVKQSLGLKDISITYVPVTAENRFKAVQDGRIDILCGATTATLSRRELVDFSLGTFIDGASVMLLANGPGGFNELAGKNVGVRGGTTTEDGLRNTLKKLSVDAKVVPVKSHDDGLSKLEKGELSAYFADRAILLFLVARSPAPDKLRVAADYYSFEPYALAVHRGDDDFRLLVDRALSRLYRGGGIVRIFKNSFGNAEPSDVLKSLYLINALPE